MEQIERAVRESCFDLTDDELKEQLSKLIVLYEGRRSLADAPLEENGDKRPRNQGLCRSCARQTDCSAQWVEGGVWRCPDYA